MGACRSISWGKHRSVTRNNWKNQAPSILNVASKWCYIGTSFIFCTSDLSEKITSNMIMIYNHLQHRKNSPAGMMIRHQPPYYSEFSANFVISKSGRATEPSPDICGHATGKMKYRIWDPLKHVEGNTRGQTCYPLLSMTMPGKPLVFVLIDYALRFRVFFFNV